MRICKPVLAKTDYVTVSKDTAKLVSDRWEAIFHHHLRLSYANSPGAVRRQLQFNGCHWGLGEHPLEEPVLKMRMRLLP